MLRKLLINEHAFVEKTKSAHTHHVHTQTVKPRSSEEAIRWAVSWLRSVGVVKIDASRINLYFDKTKEDQPGVKKTRSYRLEIFTPRELEEIFEQLSPLVFEKPSRPKQQTQPKTERERMRDFFFGKRRGSTLNLKSWSR